MTILVAYASKHGSTREVAEAIAGAVAERGHAVELLAAHEVRTVQSHEAVILGGALYTGRWHRDARAFLKQHRHDLAERPVAVFGLGPRTLAPDEVAGSRAQVDKALTAVPEVQPVSVAIFGGVVDPTQLRFPFNRMPASDARDWDAIEAWAELIAERFSRSSSAVSR
jgi:menaquinone-dependent protoporphyrinogen oxidase